MREGPGRAESPLKPPQREYTQPLSPELLAYGVTSVSDPQVSPDGTHVAYILTSIDPDTRRGRSQLWLCGIDGSRPRPLLPGEDSVAGLCWASDGTELAAVVGRAGGSVIVTLSPEGAVETRAITRHAQTIGDLAWSPDGRQIAYSTLYDPENPDETAGVPGAAPKVRVTCRLDYKEDGRGFLGEVRTHVFVVEIATGARRRVTTDLVDHEDPQWSPDGRCLAIHRPKPLGGSALILIDVSSGATRSVSPEGCRIEQWSWSLDGGRVIYAGDPGRRFQPDYFIYDVVSSATQRITDELPSLPSASPSRPSPPVWLSDQQVLVHTMRAAASQLELLDIASGRTNLIHRWEARHTGLSVDRAARYMVQAQSSFTTIAEISVYDRTQRTGRTITAYSAALLDEHPPARWERFEVTRGEFAIEAFLLLPPAFDSSKHYPLILDIHGGPNHSYGYWFMAHQQCLATNGFLVVYANPRGSTSYGGHFARQVLQDWGGEDYRDLLAVVDTVLERPYVDPARTGIFGFSYGGYMTAWAISQSDRFQAAVCGEPFFDLESAWGTSMNGQGIAMYAGGPPHERREWYAAHSPSTFGHQTRTATLILQGEADDICPIGQSEQMFATLQQAGCEVELVCYPAGSHMFFASGLPEHRADFLTRTLAWFKTHLGGPR